MTGTIVCFGDSITLSTGAVFMPDIMQGVLDDDSKKSDEIHPNAAGYELIARRAADCLRKYYKFGE